MKKHPSKISKEEEVIHNMVQNQPLTILKSVLNISIGYALSRKYIMHA